MAISEQADRDIRFPSVAIIENVIMKLVAAAVNDISAVSNRLAYRDGSKGVGNRGAKPA